MAAQLRPLKGREVLRKLRKAGFEIIRIKGSAYYLRNPQTSRLTSVHVHGNRDIPLMETAYVTSKGQLVIPAKIRRKLGIKPGTKICFVEREHEVLFQPLTKEYIRNLAGMLKSSTSATAELLKKRKLDKE